MEVVAFEVLELESLKRADLQTLSKRAGIKANGKNIEMIEGLREYAAKHHAQKVVAGASASETSSSQSRARTPVRERVTAETEAPAPVESAKGATPRAAAETPRAIVEEPVTQKSVTPKAKVDTPKQRVVTPKIAAAAEKPVEEVVSSPPIDALSSISTEAPSRRRSIRNPPPIAAATEVAPAAPVDVPPAVAAPVASAPVVAVPAFVWAPFKDETKSTAAPDDASAELSSSQASVSSTSDSERLAAMKSKAKPALAHKVLNKLKSPIKKARSPIRVAAPRPPVPSAIAKTAAPRVTNMPNFDKLHKKEFARRESLNTFQKRQAATTAAPKAPAPVAAAPRPKPVVVAPVVAAIAPTACAAASEAPKSSVSFDAAVPSTPQQKRRLSKPATPFAGAQDQDAASSSADERSVEKKTEKPVVVRAATAVRPPQVPAVPKRPVAPASSAPKKPKFDLAASLAKGALPYKAAVANSAPRVLKESNGTASAQPAKRPVEAAPVAAAKPTDTRKKMRASLAVQPTSGATGRRLSTVN